MKKFKTVYEATILLFDENTSASALGSSPSLGDYKVDYQNNDARTPVVLGAKKKNKKEKIPIQKRLYKNL